MIKVLHVIQQNIDQSLKSNYISLLSLAMTIDEEGNPKNFEEVAKQITTSNSSVIAVELVHNGIISNVYPLEENKMVLGYNILADSNRNKEAYKAINSQQMYFAGPFDLKQGGSAIVGRLPIFRKNDFWGFSAVIIPTKTLLNKSGVNQLDDDFYIQFSKVNPNTKKEEFFLPINHDISLENAKKITIEDGNWTIYITPKPRALKTAFFILPLVITSLIASILCGFFVVQLLYKPIKLNKKIKKQAKKLVHSQLKFKTIFDQARMGITQLDKEGCFLEVNQRMLEITGYSKKELLQKNIVDVFGENHGKKIIEDPKKYSISFSKKSGEIIYANVTSSTLEKNKSSTSYIAIVEDDTEKRNAKHALLDIQSKIEMAIRISNLGYWEWNVETGEITWSPVMYELFQISPSTTITPGLVLSLFHPDDVEQYIEKITNLLKGHKMKTKVFRMLPQDGNVLYVLTHTESERNNLGRTTKIKGTILNVTKEKEAEKELKKSYKLVLEQNERLLNFSYIVSHNLRSHTSNISSILTLLNDASSYEEQKELMNTLQLVISSLDQTLHNLNEVVNIQRKKSLLIKSIPVKKSIEKVLKLLDYKREENNTQITCKVPTDIFINFNPAYFESIILNIVTNAIKYSDTNKTPEIKITYLTDKKYHIIKIKDNGIGIDLQEYGKNLFEVKSPLKGQGMGLFMVKNQLEVLGGKIVCDSKLGEGTIFKLYFKKSS